MPKFYLLDDTDNVVTYTDAGDISVDALGGNDTIIATITGNATLKGGDGDDSLTGSNGLDVLLGGSGNDILLGGLGGDILDGGSGTDEITGGAGDDIYIINDGNDTITENLAEGTDTVKTGLSSYDLDNNVEVLVGTAATSQTLNGNALDNLIIAGNGDDTIDGGTGNDSMQGGQGDDTYFVDVIGDTITEGVSAGIDTVRTGLVTYTLEANVENLRSLINISHAFTGNALNNAITGGSQSDTLNGGAGNDTLSGGAGADIMIGGTGDDTYTVDNTSDTVTEDTSAGSDTVRTSLNAYALGADVENIVGTKGGGGQALVGNALDNMFSDLGGANAFVGGTGNDTYMIDNNGDSISENLSEGIDSVKTSLNTYTLAANADNLVGTSAGGGQTLNGNALDNLISDEGAANTMRGGGGNDTFIVETVGDVVTENLNEGIDTVRTTLASFTLGNNVENLQGEALTGQALTGSNIDNVIVAGIGNDTLDGGIGNDSLRGGAGDDTYIVDSSQDAVTEITGNGTDTVRTALGTITLAANVENLVGTAAGGAQVLTGNALNNTLSDTGASNTMLGGAGNDTYIVDSSFDITTENLAEGTDTIQTALSFYSLGSNFENLQGTLSIGGQTLIGNELNNSISDNGVASTMLGGLGNDTFVFDNVSDILVENLNAGVDTVKSAIGGYILGTDIENLVLLGTTVDGTGNALANVITGNAAANTLSGLDGTDKLVGGLGRDKLTGGNGKDIFDFNKLSESGKTTTTRDTITDFTHLSDRVDLATLDASTKKAGNQTFKFIGATAFHKVAGELHYVQSNAAGTINDKTIVEGDVNADGKADFQIELTGLIGLTTADFMV
jgi:Ca2+-binding RTX toxin-like protein